LAFFRNQRSIGMAPWANSSVPKHQTCHRPGQTSVNAANATGLPWCQAIRPRRLLLTM
jgi:hypothetical protein